MPGERRVGGRLPAAVALRVVSKSAALPALTWWRTLLSSRSECWPGTPREPAALLAGKPAAWLTTGIVF